jgi:hypothetical protein
MSVQMLRDWKETTLSCIFSLQASIVKLLFALKESKASKPCYNDSIKSDARTLLFATIFLILTA